MIFERKILSDKDKEELILLSKKIIEYDWKNEKYEDNQMEEIFWNYIEFFRKMRLEKETYQFQIMFERRFLPESPIYDKIKICIDELNSKILI
jgi:hypothetical protein